MSIAQNYPNLKPSLLLDFSNTEQLDPRITFSRASTATYYGTQTAKAEENLVLQSQDFTAVNWAVLNASVTANTSVAPDGTTTAETYAATASTGQHRLDQTSQSVAGTQRVLSFFVKANTHNFVQLMFGTDIQAFANFNITAGAGAVGTVGSSATASIVDAGNGWYRCIIVTASATASAQAFILLVSSATAARFESWTTAGTESIYLWGAQLEQRSAVTAYTPTTTQTITNYIPVLETAASGVARFDHNPTTFESLGLLIEEQRTNLLTYSEQFDNAAWTKGGSSITANTVVAPDGVLTGDKLVEDTATSTHNVTSSTTSASATTAYTASFFAKAGERNLVAVWLRGAAAGDRVQAQFNLTSGTISIAASVIGAFTLPNASITAVGNGWYRCTVTGTTGAGETSVRIVIFNNTPAASFSTSYTGDGTSGIYLWGAQAENGAFPTSYIPTVASQVTRSADLAVMTGTNFSDWYNASEGTLYAESRCPNGIATNINRIASLNDGTNSNRMEIDTGSATATAARIQVNGVNQGSPTAGSFTDFQLRKSALGIQLNNFTLAANTATNSDTSALVAVVDRLMIGQSPAAASNFLNGTLAKIAYYPRRLANSELQAITA